MQTRQRRRTILAQVRAQQSVKVGELSQELGVSAETIRKDILDLDERGLLERVHGGAVARANRESAYENRRVVNAQAKRDIAEEAFRLAADASSIYLDYGTTAFQIARLVAVADPDVMVVSNSLPIITALLPCQNVRLVVPGGQVRRNENSLGGPLTDRAMQGLFFDVGFFGCAGIAARSGITNFDAVENAISQLASDHCQRVVLVADHSKFGCTAAIGATPVDAVDDLVTDREPEGELASLLASSHCTIHVTQGLT
ncbi:DeoR/GlpR family DNA-binding transcription regulator [uncultured Propionibacterium sp.]|uniref:DeoR/GlpR family DNA-binding transcription regulator n=1 Tax=uncultured Propionibacterium sp. TaxID=218066 RepID=UPI00293039A9|nr:DeoR/GlpR family DNA-binding transcription regulator [uncultured Propionibacterium sp.]